MGQAKKRGTFEDRKQQAIQRASDAALARAAQLAEARKADALRVKTFHHDGKEMRVMVVDDDAVHARSALMYNLAISGGLVIGSGRP